MGLSCGVVRCGWCGEVRWGELVGWVGRMRGKVGARVGGGGVWAGGAVGRWGDGAVGRWGSAGKGIELLT